MFMKCTFGFPYMMLITDGESRRTFCRPVVLFIDQSYFLSSSRTFCEGPEGRGGGGGY